VPAVSSRKRLSDFEAPEKKRSKISHKELQRLRSIAYGGDAVHKDVVQTGDTADHDPWAVQEVKLDPVKFSFLEEEKSAKEPVTLKRAPISMAKSGKEIPAVRKPEAGKSYNPLLEDWANLIDREGAKEVEAEKKRLQEAKEDAEKLERVMAVAAAEEAEDEAEQSAWESEWEGFSEPEDGALKRKRPERKTPSQRNKINRRKAMERQAKHDARMKERDRQIRRIQELVKSIKEKEDARTTAQQVALIAAKEDMSSDTEEEVLRKKRFGKAP
jgi:nucleolar protein 53